MKTIYERLVDIRTKRGAGYLVLIDPDKAELAALPRFVETATESGADGFLIGGSLLVRDQFEAVVRAVKGSTPLPVMIFPGSLMQISGAADAMLFIVLISGRNPEYLIGSHVAAAPIIHSIGLEAIGTAYMLVEGGGSTAVEFISNTRPLPHNKPDIAVAHALAAEYIGMKLLYFDSGSGAERPVSDEIIRAVAKHSPLPIIVGGGIRTPEEARRKAQAGASFIVTGNVMEERGGSELLREFADAVHNGHAVVK